jgi:hypothetical protein
MVPGQVVYSYADNMVYGKITLVPGFLHRLTLYTLAVSGEVQRAVGLIDRETGNHEI